MSTEEDRQHAEVDKIYVKEWKSTVYGISLILEDKGPTRKDYLLSR